MTETSQLRKWAQMAGIPNSNILKPMALCVELSKSLVEYQKFMESQTFKLNCKNESNFLGDDFATMAPNNIIQDDLGYCFSLDELDQVTKSNTHPFTVDTWDKSTIQGQPFLDYIKKIPKDNLYQVHQLISSSQQEMSEESILTLKLVDLVNEPQMKYMTVNTADYYQSESQVIQKKRSKVIYQLTKQDISNKYKSSLSLFKSPKLASKFANITYPEFLNLLIQYILQMPQSYQETAKYLVLNLMNQILAE